MINYVQVVKPNINVPGYSGGCLQYVDDGVNPPNRQPTAQRSWEYAVSTGVAHHNEEPPNNVWVPVYYSIDNGQWAGFGHVAWYYSDGKTTKIYDSEYGAGLRSAPYSSGQELFNYMGWQMRYYGWSEAVDGLRVVKKKESKPQPSKKQKGIVKMFVQDNKGTYGKKEKGAQYMISSTGVYHVSPAESKVLTAKIGAPLIIGKDINEAEIDIIKATLIYGKK